MKSCVKALIIGFCLIFTLFLNFATGVEDDKGLTVLITGANRGLGLEFAGQYQARGYHVIGTARNPEQAGELRELGVQEGAHSTPQASEGAGQTHADRWFLET